MENEKILKVKNFVDSFDDRLDYFITFENFDGRIVLCNREVNEE